MSSPNGYWCLINLCRWTRLDVATLGLSNVRSNLNNQRGLEVTTIILSVNLGANLSAAPTRSRAGSPSSPFTCGGTRRPAAGLGLLPGKHLGQFDVSYKSSGQNVLEICADYTKPKRGGKLNFGQKMQPLSY